MYEGGLKAQLYRTAQGKRSGTLGFGCVLTNRHSRPVRAELIGILLGMMASRITP